jgi:hypothetical protein
MQCGSDESAEKPHNSSTLHISSFRRRPESHWLFAAIWMAVYAAYEAMTSFAVEKPSGLRRNDG